MPLPNNTLLKVGQMGDDPNTTSVSVVKGVTTVVGFSERQDKELTVSDYFGDMVLVALDKRFRDNAANLITRVNRLMRHFGQNRRVLVGLVPTPDRIFDAQQFAEFLPSRHQTAEAVDLADPEGDLDQWLMDNQKLLESCGLWLEHPAATRGHCHLQSIPPKGGSRRRLFYP